MLRVQNNHAFRMIVQKDAARQKAVLQIAARRHTVNQDLLWLSALQVIRLSNMTLRNRSSIRCLRLWMKKQGLLIRNLFRRLRCQCRNKIRIPCRNSCRKMFPRHSRDRFIQTQA